MSQRLFYLLERILFSRWVHGYEEHHGPQEDVFLAYFGLLFLEINDCFVLDHRDASVSFRVPTPWGELITRYVVCLGEEQIRQPGFQIRWWPKLPKVTCPPAGLKQNHDDEFPF